MMDGLDRLLFQETGDDSVIDGQDDEAAAVTSCTHAPAVGSDAYAAFRHWLRESFPAANGNCDSASAAATDPRQCSVSPTLPSLRPNPRQCSVSPTLPSLRPVPLRELLVGQLGQTSGESDAPKSSSTLTCGVEDRNALRPCSPHAENRPALRQGEDRPALRPYSACSSASSVSESVLELVAAAHDPVWKSLTKHFGHTHSRRKPMEWNLLRLKTLFTGALRLSLLTSDTPEFHGLEMPTTGDAVVDGETGVFRTEDELAAFHRKMADMKAMLDDELEELHDQELGIYAQHIEEDVRARKIFDEMQSVLKREMQELEHQEHVIELELQEKIHYPEPVITRPDLATADDEFSRRLREEGLTYKTGTDTVSVLRYDDLPPELDLSAVLSNRIPIPEPQHVPHVATADPHVATADPGAARADTQQPPPPPPAGTTAAARVPAQASILTLVESLPEDDLNCTSDTLLTEPDVCPCPPVSLPVGQPASSIPQPASSIPQPTSSIPPPTSYVQPASTVLSGLWSTLSSLGLSTGNDKTSKPGPPASVSAPALPSVQGHETSAMSASTSTAAVGERTAAAGERTVAKKRGIPAHPSLDSGVTVMTTRKRGLL